MGQEQAGIVGEELQALRAFRYSSMLDLVYKLWFSCKSLISQRQVDFVHTCNVNEDEHTQGLNYLDLGDTLGSKAYYCLVCQVCVKLNRLGLLALVEVVGAVSYSKG